MPATFSTKDGFIGSTPLLFWIMGDIKIPTVNIKTKVLYKHLKIKYWGDPASKIRYAPIDVLKNKKNDVCKHHYDSILKADLRYPIYIEKETGNIIDGMHRLTKAYLLQKDSIKVKYIPSHVLNLAVVAKETKKGYHAAAQLTIQQLKRIYKTKKDLIKKEKIGGLVWCEAQKKWYKIE